MSNTGYYTKYIHTAQYQTNNLNKGWGEGPNRHFPKEDTQMWRGARKDARRHQPKCRSKPQQGSPPIGQSGYSQAEERWAPARMWRTLMHRVGGDVSCCCHCGKQYRGSSKKTNNNYHTIQRVHPGSVSEVNKNNNSERFTPPAEVYGSFIYNSQDTETVQVSIKKRLNKQNRDTFTPCKSAQ